MSASASVRNRSSRQPECASPTTARRSEASPGDNVSDAFSTDEDPKSTLSYRLARAAVIILGVLLVIALALLVVGVALKMTGHHPAEDNSTAPAKFTLAPGARIVSF